MDSFGTGQEQQQWNNDGNLATAGVQTPFPPMVERGDAQQQANPTEELLREFQAAFQAATTSQQMSNAEPQPPFGLHNNLPPATNEATAGTTDPMFSQAMMQAPWQQQQPGQGFPGQQLLGMTMPAANVFQGSAQPPGQQIPTAMPGMGNQVAASSPYDQLMGLQGMQQLLNGFSQQSNGGGAVGFPGQQQAQMLLQGMAGGGSPYGNPLPDPNLLWQSALMQHHQQQQQLSAQQQSFTMTVGQPAIFPQSNGFSMPGYSIPPMGGHTGGLAALTAALPAEPALAASNGPSVEGIPSEVTTRTVTKRKKRKYTHESFPEKLHRLVLESERDGKDHIVRFTSDGRFFQILSTKGFEDEILAQYFRHNKITSFKRLLHMYGFRRVQGTWNEGTFEHELFRRDEPELCKGMERIERAKNRPK
jgi:hypothetical protein